MTSKINSIFIYNRIPSSTEIVSEYHNNTVNETRNELIRSLLIAACCSQNQTFSDYRGDVLARSTAAMIIRVISHVAYGTLRLYGYDLGKIDCVKVINLKYLFAPRYILTHIATTYLKTVSPRCLIACHIALFAISFFANEKMKSFEETKLPVKAEDNSLSELLMNITIHNAIEKEMFKDFNPNTSTFNELKRVQLYRIQGLLLKSTLILSLIEGLFGDCFSYQQWVISNIGLGAISYLNDVKLISPINQKTSENSSLSSLKLIPFPGENKEKSNDETIIQAKLKLFGFSYPSAWFL